MRSKVFRLCTVLVAMMFMAVSAIAQTITITGTVEDNNGDPIPGANVVVKGTTQGSMTDIDGKFAIPNVSTKATLRVSFIGYSEQEIPVQGKSSFKIVLTEDSELLDDVVVVGYGTVKKANVIGSIAKVNADALEDRPVTRVETALQGQMAGVSVRTTTGTPGGDVTINVRGAASINGQSTPLYVVDGVPTESLSGINPGDIQSIDVLKDAASAAIYGSRGSNGVVLVTTKKGKQGKPVIQLNAYTAISNLERKVGVMNSEEWVTFYKKYLDHFWALNNPTQNPNASQAERIAYAEQQVGKKLDTLTLLNTYKNQYGIYDPRWGTDELDYVDWQDEIFRTAPQHNLEISAAGQAGKTLYSVSAGYLNQEGIIHSSSFHRYTLRANIETQLNDYVKLTAQFAPSYGVQEGATVDGKDNAVARSLGFQGVVLHNDEYPARWAGAQPTKFYDFWGPGPNNVSPYIMATAADRRIVNSRMNSNIGLDVKIIEGLHLSGLIAWNFRNQTNRTYTPTWSQGKWDTVKTEGELSRSSYTTLTSHNWLYQGLLTYNKSIGKSDIDAVAGWSLEKYSAENTNQELRNFANDKTWVFNKTSGSTTQNNDVGYASNALVSFFGRVQYSYDSKYLFSATIRRDGSSKFGTNNRWGWFPSFSGAWKLNEEAFLKDIDWIGTAKLRVSWGVTGNDRIGNAQFLSNMAALNYPIGDTQAGANGYVIGNIANSNLGWETTKSTNIGIDFGILNDRVYFSADYYQKTTEDLLLKSPVSLISGFSNLMDNVGTVDNWGLEFEINSANIVNKDFKWNTSFNLSLNRNEITSLGTDNSDIRSGQGNTIIQRVGHPINSYMLLNVERTLTAADFEADGVTPKPGIAIWTGQKPGDSKWTDVNGDGKITAEDYDVQGSYQPKFEWGMTNTFRYKNFDASFMFQGRAGGKLLSIGSRSWNRATNGPNYNYMKSWLYDAYWSETEPGNGKHPSIWATVTGGQYDTNWLYSAAYVRLKNISAGYTFNFKNNPFVSKVRVYTSCDNVYMWDSYDPGFSPEAATQDNASSDWGSYPLARTWSLGVNVTF